jgi:uncharacterized protein HemY
MPAIDLLVALVVAGLGVAAYQGYVTARLIRFGGYSLSQKIVQSLLIWVVPLFGACLVHFVIRATEKTIAHADRNFVQQEQQYYD